jgi:hypothetical protein
MRFSWSKSVSGGSLYILAGSKFASCDLRAALDRTCGSGRSGRADLPPHNICDSCKPTSWKPSIGGDKLTRCVRMPSATQKQTPARSPSLRRACPGMPAHEGKINNELAKQQQQRMHVCIAHKHLKMEIRTFPWSRSRSRP